MTDAIVFEQLPRSDDDGSHAITLTLTHNQLHSMVRGLEELPLLLASQNPYLVPEQRTYVKLAIRNLRRYQVCELLKQALNPEGQPVES